jgi:hypothetical protein
MISGIKKCLDSGDIIGLRYIFLDSLDVDPTFEKYIEDYNVCKKLEGMFEPYIELTPLSLSDSDWNMEYWGKIKFDQKKNFSEKRFEHMREIAKIVHAEKVKRLLTEREEKQEKTSMHTDQLTRNVENYKPSNHNNRMLSEGDISTDDTIRINRHIKELELHNQAIEQEQRERLRKKEEFARQNEESNAEKAIENQSKNVLWVVVAAVIAVIIVLAVVMTRS